MPLPSCPRTSNLPPTRQAWFYSHYLRNMVCKTPATTGHGKAQGEPSGRTHHSSKNMCKGAGRSQREGLRKRLLQPPG